MKYTPRELAARISAGGRVGAAHTARIRRDKRARYLAGTMNDTERAEYENYLEQRREAGRRGGSTTAARREAGRRAHDLAILEKLDEQQQQQQ